MIVLGIDPGIAIVGYGVVEQMGNSYKVIDYGAITTDSKTPTPKRLELIHRGLGQLIEKYQVEAMAVEELFFNKNVKTAIQVAQARGVILLSGEEKNLPIYEYTPLQVKQGVVGYGRAEKSQVQIMVKTLLNLKEIPKPDDVADALAVALCHCHTGGLKGGFRVR